MAFEKSSSTAHSTLDFYNTNLGADDWPYDFGLRWFEGSLGKLREIGSTLKFNE